MNLTMLPPIPTRYLDTSKVTTFSPADVAQMDKVAKAHFSNMLANPDAPEDKIYAVVKAGGKPVATLFSSGMWTTSNDSFAKVSKLPVMSDKETATGLDLAQKRAEAIAKAFSGLIEMWDGK